MRQILILGNQLAILSLFLAFVAFYGLAFWHWRSDAKQLNVTRDNSSNPVTMQRL
jgi:hypothetical protein